MPYVAHVKEGSSTAPDTSERSCCCTGSSPRKETFPVASQLYRTTRPLYLQVTRGLDLDRLGVAALGSPTTAMLIALNVTGLILLDARPGAITWSRFRC
jgi:hypothetical protein